MLLFYIDLTSTFVNRNSYATYAGIGLICAVGLFVKNLLRELDMEGKRRKTAQIRIRAPVERSSSCSAAIPARTGNGAV